MPRQRLEVTTQETVTTSVELSPKAKRMILERINEYGALDAEVDERKARQDAIKSEIDTLFGKEGQGAALIDGAALEGHKMKWVTGSQTKLDEKKLMQLTGITPSQLAACKVTKEKKPYFKLTVKGKKDKPEEE